MEDIEEKIKKIKAIIDAIPEQTAKLETAMKLLIVMGLLTTGISIASLLILIFKK